MRHRRPREGFDASFDRLFRYAYRVAFRMLGNRQDAEDVAIETLARAALRWARLEDDPEPWVRRVATNQAIDCWRHRRLGVAADARSEALDLSFAEERLDLVEALTKIPKRQRDTVLLRYVLDLTEAATAEALGCSPGTVKQHSSRGLNALRNALVRADPTSREP